MYLYKYINLVIYDQIHVLISLQGIYDMHIHIQGVPILGWEPSSVLTNLSAKWVQMFHIHKVQNKHKLCIISRVQNIEKSIGWFISYIYN